MSLTAKEKSGEFTLVPEGVHRACCIGLIDLGTHFNAQFDKMQEKIMIIWELPDEQMEVDGKMMPMWQSKQYTLSLSQKSNLRQDLEAWRGRAFTPEELKGFDLKNILTKCCQLQIIHTVVEEKTYANIAAIMSLPKGMTPFLHIHQVMTFDFTSSLSIPEEVPEWIVTKIQTAKEWPEFAKKCTAGVPAEDSSLEAF